MWADATNCLSEPLFRCFHEKGLLRLPVTTVLWGLNNQGKAAVYTGAGVQAFCVKQGQSESACETGWLKKVAWGGFISWENFGVFQGDRGSLFSMKFCIFLKEFSVK